MSWPEHPRLHHYLGLALFQQKRFQEALPHYTQAAVQLPADANVQNQLALTLKYLKRHRDAMAVWQKILSQIPASDALPVYVNIGVNLNDAEAFDEALDWVEKGLAMSPQQQDLRITKAIALLGKERVTEAEELVQGLLAEGYRNDLVLNAWGRIRLKEGDPEVALEYLQAAERLGGSNAPTCIARGQALADLGRFDEATQAFEEALRYDPTRAEAWASIAHAHKMTQADQAWWERSEAFLAHKDLKPDHAMSLHYAMGKFCNDTQDYDRAFVHYQQANQLKRETWKESRYDRQHQEKLVQALTHRYSAELFDAWKSLANPSLRPLLIVGMPRSGTSLTEQILASHSNIYGAGELRFWSRFAARHERTVLDGTFNAHWLPANSKTP